MGCGTSKYDHLDVVGHPTGLQVLPGCERYYRETNTQLVLKEKFWSMSGDSCSVKDQEGTEWFKIKGKALSLQEKSKLLDIYGNEIVTYRKKLLSLHRQAYLTVESSGQILVYATIKQKELFTFTPEAEIFIHNPPIPFENVSTKGLVPDMVASGNIIQKDYGLVMGEMENNPYKIAEITRKLKWFNHADTYYIDAGPRVDVSLIVMIVYALDELFSHGDNN